MRREHHRWFSPALGRDMELLAFGHHGARVIVFPTSLGRPWDWEDRGMIHALHEHLERGWIQLYCVDSVDAESWYAKYRHPHDRARRHDQYERYVRDEVLPFTQQRNDTPFLMTTGANFGAYHAANFGLRHPWLVSRVIGMSGLYDIKQMTEGYSDPLVYAHDPSHYMSNLPDQGHLEALRRIDIILAIGRDDPSRPSNEHLSRVLWDRGIGNALRIWDGWVHDWPWWQQMIVRYIGGHD